MEMYYFHSNMTWEKYSWTDYGKITETEIQLELNIWKELKRWLKNVLQLNWNLNIAVKLKLKIVC